MWKRSCIVAKRIPQAGRSVPIETVHTTIAILCCLSISSYPLLLKTSTHAVILLFTISTKPPETCSCISPSSLRHEITPATREDISGACPGNIVKGLCPPGNFTWDTSPRNTLFSGEIISSVITLVAIRSIQLFQHLFTLLYSLLDGTYIQKCLLG